MKRNERVAKNGSDPVVKMQDTASALAEKVRDARLDERAADLASMAREKVRDAQLDARAAELVAAARRRAQETGLEDWATDIVARVRESAMAQEAAETAAHVAGSAREAADRTLDAVGEWLEDTPVGDRLGIRRRRRVNPWSIAAAGVAAAGVAAGVLAGRRRPQQLDDDIWGPAEGAPLPDRTPTTAPNAALPLDARVREAIGQDPRTSSLPELNVNVVGSTVFVRGTVGSDVDQDVLRTVIEGVEGVTDVDLQVTASA
ncbi:MAG: hypothetical protein GEU74_07390 [Nitriliruptorales bacterium]|nr:hypothetical protein [Nitriliruptorales bacterium]